MNEMTQFTPSEPRDPMVGRLNYPVYACINSATPDPEGQTNTVICLNSNWPGETTYYAIYRVIGNVAALVVRVKSDNRAFGGIVPSSTTLNLGLRGWLTQLAKQIGIKLPLAEMKSGIVSVVYRGTTLPGGCLSWGRDVLQVTGLPDLKPSDSGTLELAISAKFEIRGQPAEPSPVPKPHLKQGLLFPDNYEAIGKETVKESGVGIFHSDLQEYTPSSIQGFGAITNFWLGYRRVGGSMEITARFTTGTITAPELQISLPTGHTALTTGGCKIVGYCAHNGKTGAAYARLGLTYLRLSLDDKYAPTSLGGTFYTVVADEFYLRATVDIAEWSSSGTVNLPKEEQTEPMSTESRASESKAPDRPEAPKAPETVSLSRVVDLARQKAPSLGLRVDVTKTLALSSRSVKQAAIYAVFGVYAESCALWIPVSGIAEILFEAGITKSKDPRSLGDFLGLGKGGLNLEKAKLGKAVYVKNPLLA